MQTIIKSSQKSRQLNVNNVRLSSLFTSRNLIIMKEETYAHFLEMFETEME